MFSGMLSQSLGTVERATTFTNKRFSRSILNLPNVTFDRAVDRKFRLVGELSIAVQTSEHRLRVMSLLMDVQTFGGCETLFAQLAPELFFGGVVSDVPTRLFGSRQHFSALRTLE
jgi:hypothetical protein